MIASRYLVSTLYLMLCVSLPVFADLPASPDWSLARDKDGIRIYSQRMSNSDFEAFKAVTVLNVPLSNVMAVMADPTSCVDWVHGCVHSEGLGGGDFHDRSAYSVNDLPWPAQDRDYVLRIRTHTEHRQVADSAARGNEPQPVIIMQLSAIPDKRRSSSGKVRVEHSDTLYEFYDFGDGRTHMTWVQHTEPNGALPSWLVNSLAIDIPFNSMQRLEKLANTTPYHHHQLVFDSEGRLVAVEREGTGAQSAVAETPSQ